MHLERFTDKAGDLFIKIPLISNLKNQRGWRATEEANAQYAATAIGKPLTLMFNKEESLFRDFHPFSPDAPITDRAAHVNFAEKYAYGRIVDVTQDSGSYKSGSGEIPWFAIAKITDPTMAEEWRKPHTRLIPPAFSPGIAQLQGPDDAITQYEILHVASVPSGAFGPKFVALGKCEGDIETCTPKLRAATSLENIHAEILSTAESFALAGREEEVLENPVLWSATIDGRNCGVCERLDGSVFNRDEAERHFPAHNNCRCELRTELGETEILGASYISPKIKRRKKKKLQAASTLDYKERCGVCPKDAFSSLLLKSANSESNNMSFNSNAQSTPGPMSFGQATVSSPSGETMATQNVAPKTKPTIYIKKLRLSGQSQGTEPKPNDNGEGQEGGGNGNGETGTGNNLNPNANMMTDPNADRAFRSSIYYQKMKNMEKQLNEQKAQWDYKEKRYQLEKIIKPSLFVDGNNKFQQKAWENEIETAIKENVSIEWLKKYYANMEMLKQVPEIKTKRASAPEWNNPLGSLQSASSLEADEERIKAEKALRLNGGY